MESNGGCFTSSSTTQQVAHRQSIKKSKPKPEKHHSIAKKLLHPIENQQALQDCSLTGPLAFDQNQVSILDLVPSLIHVAPIICIDFSLANLTFSSTGTSIHTPNVSK